MSGSIDQRTKGQPNQVSNGPSSRENDFDYMQQAHASQAYGSAQMSSPNVSDPYYYPQYMFPNPNHTGLNDGTSWSPGDAMSFLGGYPGQMGNNDYMSSNMFGFDYSQPNFGWGYSGGDYSSTWGTSSQVRKSDERGYQDNYSYMGQNDYMNGEVSDRGDSGVKAVEHGLKSMNLGDRQDGRETRQTSTGGSSGGSSGGGSGSAVRTWAAIAKQPARPQPQLKTKAIPRAPVLPNRHNMDIGTWDNKNSANKPAGPPVRQAWGAARPTRPTAGPYSQGTAPAMPGSSGPVNSVSSPMGVNNGPSQNNGTTNGAPAVAISTNAINHPVLDKLRAANQYNPKNFNLSPENVRFFIIKSYSEDDIHRSIKYGIWCSTDHGNKRLDQAYREREGKGPIYLLYSVNGSGHFCGMSQMMSPVDYNSSSGVWAQDKWKGQIEVKWIYVKDVPNSQLRHIRLENNENKPVTNSRDTQEVPPEKGKQVLRIIHQYRHTTSIFDDFSHYEKRQEEDVQKDDTEGQGQGGGQRNDRRNDRDRNDRGNDRGGDRNDRGVDRGDRGGDRGDRGDRGGDRGGRDRRGDRGDDRGGDHDRRRPRNLQH